MEDNWNDLNSWPSIRRKKSNTKASISAVSWVIFKLMQHIYLSHWVGCLTKTPTNCIPSRNNRAERLSYHHVRPCMRVWRILLTNTQCVWSGLCGALISRSSDPCGCCKKTKFWEDSPQQIPCGSQEGYYIGNKIQKHALTFSHNHSPN